MCLVVSMDSVFLVENPAKSSILNHPRMQWLFKQLRALDIKALWLQAEPVQITLQKYLWNDCPNTPILMIP